MTQASRARAPQPADGAAPRRPHWAGPLVAGLAFGLAYGVTQRLVTLNVGELIRFGQGFDVQVFPGTSLESLRLRFGAADAELRGNLELQQLERQQNDDAPRSEPVQADAAQVDEAAGEPGSAEAEPHLSDPPGEPEPPASPPQAAPASPPAPPPDPSPLPRP